MSLLVNKELVTVQGHQPLPQAVPDVSSLDLSCVWTPTQISQLVLCNYLFPAAGRAVLGAEMCVWSTFLWLSKELEGNKLDSSTLLGIGRD